MSKIAPGQSVKRAGSAIAGASGSGAKKRYCYPVHIPEDVWIDALKYLNCLKWSKMRLASRHLNGMVQRNVSRLPLAIIDSAEIRLKERKMTEVKLIVSNSAILPNEKDQWFKDQGMTIDVPASIQLNNAVLGVEFKKNWCADLCILGPAQKKKLTSSEKTRPWFFGQQFKAEVLFYTEFRPHRNKYSWASMAFFLKVLYDQSTYIKELSMYALDKKLKEIMFADEEERYVRCGSFTLQVSPDPSVEDLCESVSWLEQNLQADNIRFPSDILYDDYICDAISNFILGPSWKSANQVVKLGMVNDIGTVNNLERFFKALIKKFRTIGTVKSIFPTLLFSGLRLIRNDPLDKLLSGNWKAKDEPEHLEGDQKLQYSKYIDPEDDSDDPGSQESENSEDNSDDSKSDDNRIRKRNYGDDGTYTISNGANRMRIEFVREPEKLRNFGNSRVHICRFAYVYDIRVKFKANE